MNSINDYLEFCDCAKKVTNISVALLDLETTEFLNNEFCKQHKSKLFCQSYGPHIHGAYQTQRSERASCIYSCPRGFSFFCVSVSSRYVLICGPVIPFNLKDKLEIDSEVAKDIPVISEDRMRTVEKWFRMSIEIGKNRSKSAGKPRQITEGVFVPAYSVDTLRELFTSIREGNYPEAQQLLNQLTDSIIEALSYDLDALEWQTQELFIRMGRAAVKGGAERAEVMHFCTRYLQMTTEIRQVDGYREWLNTALKKLVDFVFDINDAKHRSVIFKTNEYLKAHLSEHISISDAAHNVFLSKSYFSRIITAELGMTFNDYLTTLRINRSKVLLRDRTLSLTEIAHEVGFSDQAYFTRVFKCNTGTTPGKYRLEKV